ncbi:MAG: ATP-binding protein [Gemmatimonadota bacterium]|jgi:signal transduction histidine kinase
MVDADLVDRLAALPDISAIPRGELAWLVANGRLQAYEAGEVIAPKGERVRHLWIILSGSVAVRVDRGAGPRQVATWRAGQVSGMLPYSRMKGPPGDNYIAEPGECLSVHEDRFPDMIHQCPTFTAYTVHLMLDRARNFNTSDLQDEKMISLGKLAAGLAHEINNPASATARGAKLLSTGLTELDAAAQSLGAVKESPEFFDTLRRIRETCLAKPPSGVLSPLQHADREDELADWLELHGSDPDHATALVETGLETAALDALVTAASGPGVEPALRWLAVMCSTQTLTDEIEQAATRIHELVAAIKSFTYMDQRAGPEWVEVGVGLRDTIRIMASKAKSKGATVTLDVEPDLPRAWGTGGELNQVWLNLIDNALDALREAGTVHVSAARALDRVVVRVVDDGHGIPSEIADRIFDPFFTTKPPGEGTGLGLDITRRLLRRYQGDIAVDSRPGRTELRVSLRAETAD